MGMTPLEKTRAVLSSIRDWFDIHNYYDLMRLCDTVLKETESGAQEHLTAINHAIEESYRIGQKNLLSDLTPLLDDPIELKRFIEKKIQEES